jgi:hypothetical protein
MKMSFGLVAALAAVPALFLLGAGSAAAQPGSGNPPPPKGFEAASASFVSPGTGFVLGARKCSKLPCPARLEKTVNGGKTWSPVPAPAVSLTSPFAGSPKSGVATVRFENASDGWLFGPAVWATTDGGQHWNQESMPGEVIAVAASGGVAFAAAEPVDGGLNAARLYRSQVGSTTWTRVPDVRPAAALTVSGHIVWAGVAPNLWLSADGGQHWAKLPFHCPASLPDASAVAAASTADAALVCFNPGFPQPGSSVKVVFATTDGGHTFHATGRPPEPGEPGILAMPPAHPQLVTLTAASGATFIYRSADSGKTWQTTTYDDGGLGTRDLAYVSATTGYMIHFSGGPYLAYTKGLLKTVNAGASWTAIAIP